MKLIIKSNIAPSKLESTIANPSKPIPKRNGALCGRLVQELKHDPLINAQAVQLFRRLGVHKGDEEARERLKTLLITIKDASTSINMELIKTDSGVYFVTSHGTPWVI